MLSTADLLTKGKLFQQPSILTNTATEHSNQQRLYPNLGFNCSGRITNISFVALEGASSARQHLELQFWHKESDSQYIITINSLSLADAVRVEFLNLYQVTVKEHLYFASGDVIGLYLPPEENSRHIIQFQPLPQTEASLSYSSNRYQKSNTIFEIGASHVEQDYDVPMIFIESGETSLFM